MKELKEAIVHSDRFDIDIKRFLTYAQIQKIIETTIPLKTWALRKTNIDLMVLCYATNMDIDEIQKIGIDKFVESGLMEEVCYTVENYDSINDGLIYHESIAKALFELSEKLPEIKETLNKELIKK